MKKRVIGIVPAARLFDTDDYYLDQYVFVNLYGLRVSENGGVPMGLLAVDGYLSEDALMQCDALLICGGRRIFPFHLQAVEHAVRCGKPLLGICLGLQAINSYFLTAEEAGRRGYTGPLLTLYEEMKRERYLFTEPVAHHWDVSMVRDRQEEAKHTVRVEPGTMLGALLGTDVIRGATMHNYRIRRLAEGLRASGYAEDGTVEALEYGTSILAVQFHPEVDCTLDPLFRFLTGATAHA